MLVLAAVMALQSPIPAWFHKERTQGDWSYLGTSPNQQIVFLTRPGHAADQIEIRIEFLYPVSGIYSADAIRQVNCRQRLQRQVSSNDYSRPNLNNLQIRINQPEDWGPPADGTMAVPIFNRACNIRDTPLSTSASTVAVPAAPAPQYIIVQQAPVAEKEKEEKPSMIGRIIRRSIRQAVPLSGLILDD